VQLSRRTFSVVRQNMIFAVFYIVVFGGLSIGGQIAPIVAALLHGASSIVVVFNSARLVREGEEIEHAEATATGRPQRLGTAPVRPVATPGSPA
jgi:Cd2+/Zn2+-exporting ATPase